ncbi:MAG: ABC transporter transmembrane domain-containing protein, partial [Gallionella sp.]
MNSSPIALSPPLAISWQTHLAQHFQPLPEILARLEINLSTALHFERTLLLLTSQGLISLNAQGELREFSYRDALELTQHDHAGVGTLTLADSTKTLAHWRYTLSVDAAASAFIKQFAQQRDCFLTGTAIVSPAATQCEKCGATLLNEHCPQCDNDIEVAPSTWTLFKLWRFARPYRWQLLSGFLLMLASTAATLVPPYLTMPLMDKVLIPYQNGAPIDTVTVAWLLGGLFASALLAWGLGWAKTYILALVSERIGADLRTETYEHLLKLSLEYFGGKRTGDLMSRIGSESDRICVFLSLHLLDFATDVLMILMTAAILISINPWLAVVTLLPLPIIAWMIHIVRDKLRTGFEKIDRVWSQVSNVLADTIPGIRVVKAFAQEDREASRFREANQHNLLVNDHINKIWSLFSPSVTLLTEIGLLVVWAFGIWL